MNERPEDGNLTEGTPGLTKLTPKKRRAVEARIAGGTWDDCAGQAGVAHGTIGYWRSHDPAFAEAWATADELCVEALEGALEVAALKAKDDPRYIRALIFALKYKRPSKWRDKWPVEHSASVNLALLSPAEIARRAALIEEP